MTTRIYPWQPADVDTRHAIAGKVFVAQETTGGDDQLALTQIERAPDSTSSPGNPSTGDIETVGSLLSKTEAYFTDYLPNDGKLRHYRARHVAQGYDDSPATGWINAKPALALAQDEEPVQVQTIFGGAQTLPDSGSTSRVAKTIRIANSAFVPNLNTQSWNYVGSYLAPNTSGVNTDFDAPMTVPQGSVITRLRARLYRATTDDTALVQMFFYDSTGVGQTLTTVQQGSSDGTGWDEIASSAMSETVSSTGVYQLSLRLNSVGGGLNARIAWVEIDYEQSTVEQSL